jgi:hypothetical protein
VSKDIADSLIAGAAMGGGQSQEHIEYNAHTQVVVPVLQAIWLILTTLIIAAGLYLLAAGLVNVARRCETVWDLAFFAIVITLSIVAAASAILAVTGKLTDNPPRWLATAAYLAAILWVMGLLNLIRVADGWTWLDSARLPAAIALLIAGGLLSYRFVNELKNPLYPPSPTTAMLRDFILSQLDQEPERVMVRRPIPHRVNGRRGEIDWMREAEPEPPPAAETRVDEDFLDLIALVQRAAIHGWARDNHLKRPRLRMPSGRPLIRSLFDTLTDLAAEPWQIIYKSGISGDTPEWLMEPDDALDLLHRVYRAQFDPEGHVLPIEDPATRQATRQAGT